MFSFNCQLETITKEDSQEGTVLDWPMDTPVGDLDCIN